MSNRMTNEEVKVHLGKLQMVMQVALTIPTKDLLHEFNMNDTLGPLLDPTGWMSIRDNAKKNEQAVRALDAFNAEILKVFPEFAVTDATV